MSVENSIPQALGTTVIVQEKKMETVTQSGIHLPDAYRTTVGDREMNHTRFKTEQPEGTVVAVGPGKQYPDGTFHPLSVAVGDTVIFSRMTGVSLKYDNAEYLVVDERDIYAIVTEDVSTAA